MLGFCASPPGDSQLRPRRVWDHHPLGLRHGGSAALREHPAGQEAAEHPPRAPPVSTSSPGICDSSSLGITAEGWEQHRDTHTQSCSSSGSQRLISISLPFSRWLRSLHELPGGKAFKYQLIIRGKVHQVLSGIRLGSAESPAVHLHQGTGCETELGTPEVCAGCSNTQGVIRFTGSPPGGKSSLVGRSSEAPREVTAALGARAWATPVFLTFLPGQSLGHSTCLV